MIYCWQVLSMCSRNTPQHSTTACIILVQQPSHQNDLRSIPLRYYHGAAMTLLKFLSKLTPDQKKDFLMKLLRDGVPYHRNAIRACATGRRQPSPTLALQIDLHSEGLVARWELRPDIW